MEKSLVTIGLPCFNAERHIRECVQSILNQSYDHFELIIVNDGSTDNTDNILRSFKDPRIKYLNDVTQRGLVYRLNQLIDLAAGDYFVRMDSDDIMFPYRVEDQLEKLLLNPYPNSIVSSGAVLIDLNNRIIGYRGIKTPRKKREVLLGIYPIHPAVMGSIMWFRKYKYDSRMYRIEDLDLWYRAFEGTNFVEIEKPCIFYRKNSSMKPSSYFVTLIPVFFLLRIHKEYFYGGMLFFKMMLMGFIKFFLYKSDLSKGLNKAVGLNYQSYLDDLLRNEK